MQTQLNPYISFRDTARQAMEFYHAIFGGELDMTTFKDGGMPFEEAEADRIMHAQLKADNGLTFMAADTPASMEYKGICGMSMSLSGDDEEQLTGFYHKLAEGGNQTMPIAKAPWGDTFGMVIDKFGVMWMVNISPKA